MSHITSKFIEVGLLKTFESFFPVFLQPSHLLEKPLTTLHILIVYV